FPWSTLPTRAFPIVLRIALHGAAEDAVEIAKAVEAVGKVDFTDAVVSGPPFLTESHKIDQ
ncbi:MAG: hypothetical protein RL693_32, partial [Verrucomicrobiota bacterium]